MRERRHDFLDVVGHQHQRGRISLARERVDELQKFLTRHGIETGARFVEDEQAGTGHERAR